jgi:hypothetical protein
LLQAAVGVPGIGGLDAVGVGEPGEPPGGVVVELVRVEVGRPDADQAAEGVVEIVGAVSGFVLQEVEQAAGGPANCPDLLVGNSGKNAATGLESVKADRS